MNYTSTRGLDLSQPIRKSYTFTSVGDTYTEDKSPLEELKELLGISSGENVAEKINSLKKINPFCVDKAVKNGYWKDLVTPIQRGHVSVSNIEAKDTLLKMVADKMGYANDEFCHQLECALTASEFKLGLAEEAAIISGGEQYSSDLVRIVCKTDSKRYKYYLAKLAADKVSVLYCSEFNLLLPVRNACVSERETIIYSSYGKSIYNEDTRLEIDALMQFVNEVKGKDSELGTIKDMLKSFVPDYTIRRWTSELFSTFNLESFMAESTSVYDGKAGLDMLNLAYSWELGATEVKKEVPLKKEVIFLDLSEIKMKAEKNGGPLLIGSFDTAETRKRKKEADALAEGMQKAVTEPKTQLSVVTNEPDTPVDEPVKTKEPLKSKRSVTVEDSVKNKTTPIRETRYQDLYDKLKYKSVR
jgi:hypothetical protein